MWVLENAGCFFKIVVGLRKIVYKGCTVGISTRFKLIKLCFLQDAS